MLIAWSALPGHRAVSTLMNTCLSSGDSGVKRPQPVGCGRAGAPVAWEAGGGLRDNLASWADSMPAWSHANRVRSEPATVETAATRRAVVARLLPEFPARSRNS